MQPFSNILVGIDLTQYDPTSFHPSAVVQEVVRQAFWLAEKTSSHLTFFAALDINSEALPHLDQTDFRFLATTAEQNANKILGGLVKKAKERGIEAVGKLALGSGWLELVRQAMRDKHDLILIGTRDRRGLDWMLFGSTAVKVIRRSPCPVWVAKPATEPNALKILVASDLKPVSEVALELVVKLAQATPVVVHLLHVVDFPLDHLWSTGLPDAKGEAYRHRVRQNALQELQAQIDRTGARTLTPPIEVHLLDEPGCLPDEGILKFIGAHPIDLLVMGTIGRTGLAGVMIGNTAERILPELRCSLLAVKPKDYVSPVHL
jgi:universal stress protein E